MFVRKDKDGNLIAVGSIHHARLAQLQAAAKKPRKSAAPKVETVEPPTPEPVKEPEPVESKKTVFKSVLDKG